MTASRKAKKRPAKAAASAALLFKKILIANRGEIACRVIRTCKRLGIATVAVYSDADSEALHVREADEAVRIGPAPSRESYLNIDAIIRACKQTGAEAVHPGYGFLSENTKFAAALEKAKIVFIGPDPKAIFAMGDKIESKKLAQKAGVAMVPGYLAAIPDAETAVKIARGIGYPVMIKASAGGGGKGMRLAHNDAECREGFRSATSEAKSSFGDDRVFIEKFIENPHHIEIQVLADNYGNTVYLGERECSIQRRHQKVIEEAPSPHLDAKTRAAMGEQAVALAKKVKYRSAGTVEFVVDARRKFYFLEMNTRLQVEHPVTECVTGLDLVEQMIRIAAGEKLAFRQSDIKPKGWAIEARIYAEDPFRDFLPSTGRVTRYRPPGGAGGVRVDGGTYEGGEISMFYDPMIAKLITSGADRNVAVERMLDALDAFDIGGVGNNVPFLAALVDHKRFRAGTLTTGFIAEEFPKGFRGATLTPRLRTLFIAVAAVAQRRMDENAAGISGQAPGRAVHAPDLYTVRLDGEKSSHQVRLAPLEGGYAVAFDDEGLALIADWQPGEAIFQARLGGDAVTLQIARDGLSWRLSRRGAQVRALVLPPRVAELAARMPVKQPPDTSKFLLSPMPGLLKSLAVAEGQDVKHGQELAVVEAMKMENILRAARDGKVARVHAGAGDTLAVDQKIVEFV